jgi:hypothetical protein
MLGYLGFVRLTDIYLLANSTGLDRQVNPIISNGVWGAGWYNAADVTNYADSQMHFEGAINFELQAISSVWNLIRDWLIEQRVFAKSAILSPNGIQQYFYTQAGDDPRSGLWASQAGFTIDAGSIVGISLTGIGLKRLESNTNSAYTDINVGPGLPTAPMNPSPRNRNPIPGWKTIAEIDWPNSPPYWTPDEPLGMAMMNGNVNFNNNTQIIRACTGDRNPIAVVQGTMRVDGSIALFRNGPIPDPYEIEDNFTAEDASVAFRLGGTPDLAFSIPNVVLSSDAFPVQGKNTPVTRTFGFFGVGDGSGPPMTIDQA